MEFRQCPACQASVLDDDAAECPFCGASMSGKPAGKSAPATQTATAAAKPGGKAAVPAKAETEAPKRQTPRRVGETVADEDDPFGIDTSTVTQVPKVAPKPAKGRMIRIQCPMCETPGFISSKMQGRDVKCCNSDCMVPVFKAPAPKKQETEAGTKKGGLSGQTLVIGSIVVLVLGGLIFWGFFASRWRTGGDPPEGSTKTYNFDPTLTGAADPQPDAGNGNESSPPPGPQQTSLTEIKQQALRDIVTAAQVRDDNRKPYGRRLAAEAYALAGDLSGAREQLSQLQKVGRAVPYFQVEPLLLIAWNQHARGDTAGAAKSIQQATEAYRELSQVGREVLSAGMSLAAAQAAFDQIPQAQQTLRQLDAERERARVASLLQIVTSIESNDLDELLHFSSLDMATDPLAVAVAVELAARGLWDKAIVWARAQPDVASQEDCLSAISMTAARQAVQTGDTAAVTQLQGLSGISVTATARIQAGLATGYLMLADQPQAKAALAKGLELFETIPPPTAVPTATVKQIHDSDGQRNAGLPAEEPLRSAAVAAAQLARLQVLLGQTEPAWTTLLKAWDFTAGIGPEYGTITSLTQQLENRQTQAQLQARLNRDLNLQSNDDKRRGMFQFRRQLRDFDRAAQARFNIETVLLREAAGWGFADQVAAMRKQPTKFVPAATGQPYQLKREEDELLKVFADAEQLFAAGKYTEAAAALAAFDDLHHHIDLDQRRDQRALQLACRLLKLKKIDELFRYAEALGDAWLTEDALEMTAALSVLTGQGPEFWQRFQRQSLQPTDRVAVFRGLISGIISAERRPKLDQTAATE